MRYLISLLFILSIFKSVLADYQYAYCSVAPVAGASSSVTGFIRIYKNDNDNGLTFNYSLSSTITNMNLGVTINTYGYPVGDSEVYNPNDETKGCPFSSSYRVGDLNDVYFDGDGQGINTVMYQKPSLLGDQSIIGRSINIYNDSICFLATNALSINEVKALPPVSIIASCVIGIANTTVLPDVSQPLSGVNTAAASTTLTENGVVALTSTNKANGETSGLVSFSKVSGGVQILSVVTGLSKEAHGFHIHAFGQLSDDGGALGGHWSKSGQVHSLPTDDSTNRHFGDLGNICSFDAEFKNAYYNYTTNYFNLNDVFGHGFAVHATRDLGNATVGGARILQGVVAIANPSITPSNVSPSASNFKFDNICENGAVDGETNSNSSSSLSSSSSDSGSEANTSSKLFSSLFILGLFSSLFVLFF